MHLIIPEEVTLVGEMPTTCAVVQCHNRWL